MIWFYQAFAKITGWPLQKLIFRTKVLYEDKRVQSRCIKGAAILVSNHTSIYDYIVMMFTFISRTLRYQMAELLFDKKGLGGLLKRLGGIKVDRNSHNYGFIEKSKDILDKGGVVGIFPEGRLPKDGEVPPIEFKSGAAYLALYSDVRIIPTYLSGGYFGKKRAKIVIGKPIDVNELYDSNKSEKENLEYISNRLREKVIELGTLINGKQKRKQA